MKLDLNLLWIAVLLPMTATHSNAQTEPKAESATPAVLEAFRSHDIVMLGEAHGNRQERKRRYVTAGKRGLVEFSIR
jgi:hypothetical protein